MISRRTNPLVRKTKTINKLNIQLIYYHRFVRRIPWLWVVHVRLVVIQMMMFVSIEFVHQQNDGDNIEDEHNYNRE